MSISMSQQSTFWNTTWNNNSDVIACTEILSTFDTRVKYISLLRMNSKTPVKPMDKKSLPTPPKPPFPWTIWTPMWTPMPGATPYTTPNSSLIALCTFTQLAYAVKFPLTTIGCHTFTPKLPLHMGRSPPQSICLVPGRSRPTVPDGIHMYSAVFSQSTGQSHRQTDRQTNWQMV